MNHIRKVFPAFLAIGVFLIGIMSDWLGVIPLEQWGRFERVCNALMIIIGIAGLLNFFSEKANVEKMFRILSNMAVSGSAFCMNTYVFQHVVRKERFWKDIEGIHSFWILFAIVQILLLSGLGASILNAIRTLLKSTKNAIEYLRGVAYTLVESTDKYVLCFLFVVFILWVIYIVNQKSAMSSGTMAFYQTTVFWITGIFICVLVRVFPLVIQKAMKGVEEMEARTVLGAVLLIALVGVTYALPSFLLVIIPLVLILFVAFWGIRKNLKMVGKAEGEDKETTVRNDGGNDGKKNDGSDTRCVIKYSDLVIVILSFTLPLFIVLTLAFLQPEVRSFFSEQEEWNIDTFCREIEKILETAESLLSLSE